MIGNNFLDIMMHFRFMGHQSYVLLCIETTLSNPPVVEPKSSCNVHLLRSPCVMSQALIIFSTVYNFQQTQLLS